MEVCFFDDLNSPHKPTRSDGARMLEAFKIPHAVSLIQCPSSYTVTKNTVCSKSLSWGSIEVHF